MAATVSISCPDCGKQLKAPADVIGKKIRCKGCNGVFKAEEDVEEVEDAVDEVDEVEEAKPKKGAVKKAAGKKDEAKKEDPKKKKPTDEEANPYGVTDLEEGNRCPHCAAEMLSEDAIICVECGYNTSTREQGRTKMLVEHTGLEVFLWLLPGILNTLLILLMIAWIIIHWCFLVTWVDDPEKWYWYAILHLSCRIWTTVALLFAIAGCGYFAFKRLILENEPPEKEMRRTK
jgi:hypothetical protein